jgi:hypothetical protein
LNGIDLLNGLWGTTLGVVEAVLPLAAIFLLFQFLWLKLPRGYVISIIKGTVFAALGLLLFLQGVHIGFLPFGRAIGEALGAMESKWVLGPFGFVLGFFTTWGEPAVRILADQVEEASSGSIRQSAVIVAICVAVGLIVSMGMFRIAYDIPLIYILLPGYALAIVIMWLSDKDFVSIAVDAGGVATGPMANTFLLALALGIASSMGERDPLVHGLGLMALIAIAPILSVMALGFIFRGIRNQKGEDR